MRAIRRVVPCVVRSLDGGRGSLRLAFHSTGARLDLCSCFLFNTDVFSATTRGSRSQSRRQRLCDLLRASGWSARRDYTSQTWDLIAYSQASGMASPIALMCSFARLASATARSPCLGFPRRVRQASRTPQSEVPCGRILSSPQRSKEIESD